MEDIIHKEGAWIANTIFLIWRIRERMGDPIPLTVYFPSNHSSFTKLRSKYS